MTGKPPNKKIHLPDKNEIRRLNDYQDAFNRECAGAIKWIYKVQKWKSKELERKIPGVPASVWRAYGQQGYGSARSLHICAALSWLTQITMSAYYYGNKIESFWPEVDSDVIECIAYSGLLPTELFEYLIQQLLLKAGGAQNNNGFTRQSLDQLAQYPNDHFLMPDVLNIDAFKRDYYYSVAINLRKFREHNGLRKEDMAFVLAIPVGKYETFEDPEKPTAIPLYAAMRLKLGFQIENTVSFTDHMREFNAFTNARNIQQLREAVIINLMRSVNSNLRKKFVKLAHEIMQFHLN